MSSRTSRFVFIQYLAVYMFAAVSSDRAYAQDADALVSASSISGEIRKIENQSAGEQKRRDAHRLRIMIEKLPADSIDDTTIGEIAALLEDRDDTVRFWIAATLGKIGPRAKQTIPALESALKKIECVPGSLTSEPAIRLALIKIGKNPPPPLKCPIQ
jgi:hypothetical protein